MTDNSDNSFNTNSYRTKVSLEDIDTFIYDIQNDTDNIVRDFHKNKAVMKTYFSGVVIHYKDMEEEILLLVYLVLCMKTKLNHLDKSIAELVFQNLEQRGGTLDETTYESLNTVLPLAFDSIYSEYAQYKMKYINKILESRNITYLDQLLEPPVLSNSTEIIPFSGVTYFTSYYHFYAKIMTYLKDFLSKIQDEFRQNEISELVRYYLYRKVLEIDEYDEYQINKNNELRYILERKEKITGDKLLNLLYGDKIEAHIVNNVLDGLRSRVDKSSPIVLKIQNELSKIKSNLTSNDRKGISYFSKTFDRLTNRVTNLLEYKSNQLGGSIIKLQEIGEDEPIKGFRRIINKILYSFLRTSDSVHDFLIGQRTTPAFKKKDLISKIKFYVDKETGNGKQLMNYLDILKDISGKKIFSKNFSFDEDGDEDNILNLIGLSNLMQSRSNFETNTMEYLNKFIYEMICLDDTPGKHIKKELLEVYRPGNIILESLLLNPDMSTMNTAQYVNKENLIENESTGSNKEIFKEAIDNLLFVIYDETILNEGMGGKRKAIIATVKNFLGIQSVPLSVDFYSSSALFFKIFTNDSNDGGKDIFIRPNRVLAEIWDPATMKTVKGMTEFSVTQTIQGDILEKEEYIPICDKDYGVTFEEKDYQLFVKAGINIKDISSNLPKEIDIENIDRQQQFHPEVKKVANLIDGVQDDSKICKLLYLKNSGDWGQATSAKQNKTFLLTEDKLCSYYSVLTNTSTVYTIKRGDKYLTFLHKGNIDMKWNEILKLITTSLKDNQFDIFASKIEIQMSFSDKSDKSGIYTLTFTINDSGVTVIQSPEEFIEINDLTRLKIESIKYAFPGSSQLNENDLIKPKQVMVKDASNNRDLSLAIISHFTSFSKLIKNVQKAKFVLNFKEKFSDLYEEQIFSDFYDTYYYDIIKYLQTKDDSLLSKIETRLLEYIKNKVTDIIKENIVKIYLLSLRNRKFENPIFVNYHSALLCFFDKTYETLSYLKKGSLTWLPFTIDSSEDIEKQTKLTEEIERVKADENIKKKNITLQLFGTKKYKTYHIPSEKNIYYMEQYHYILPNNFLDSEKHVLDILFLSSIATTGLWDLFSINSFIYSLVAEYLKKNYELLSELYTDREDDENKQLELLYNTIDETLLDDDSRLKKFILSEKSKYNSVLPRSKRGADTSKYIQQLNESKIYELLVFYYLYSKFVKKDDSKQIIFNSMTNTKKEAEMEFRYGGKNYGLSGKIEINFFKKYLNMLEKISEPKKNTKLIEILNSDNYVSRYIQKIIRGTEPDDIQNVFKTGLRTIKDLSSDDEYYSTVISILKTIKTTLEINEQYLEPSNSIPSKVNSFVYMLSLYLDEYDDLVDKIKENKFQFYKLTKTLLEKIIDNIKDIPELQYVSLLLKEVIEIDINVEKTYADDSRLQRITEIGNNLGLYVECNIEEAEEIDQVDSIPALAVLKSKEEIETEIEKLYASTEKPKICTMRTATSGTLTLQELRELLVSNEILSISQARAMRKADCCALAVKKGLVELASE